MQKLWAFREPQNMFHGLVPAEILKEYCDQRSIKEFIIPDITTYDHPHRERSILRRRIFEVKTMWEDIRYLHVSYVILILERRKYILLKYILLKYILAGIFFRVTDGRLTRPPINIIAIIYRKMFAHLIYVRGYIATMSYTYMCLVRVHNLMT